MELKENLPPIISQINTHISLAKLGKTLKTHPSAENIAEENNIISANIGQNLYRITGQFIDPGRRHGGGGEKHWKNCLVKNDHTALASSWDLECSDYSDGSEGYNTKNVAENCLLEEDRFTRLIFDEIKNKTKN